MDAVAKDYASILRAEGYDSPRAIAATPVAELERKRIRPGHARAMHACAEDLGSDEGGASAGVKIFDYDTIVKSLSVADAIETVEDAFCKLAQDKVDVPMPMHITIDETATAGPGDCHVKGGYVSGAATWTVKVASKPGREGKELIVVDLTGTGAQDAAIGQVAWDKLGN